MGKETRLNPVNWWRPLIAAAWAHQRRPVMVMTLAIFGWSLGWSAAGQVEGPAAEPKACTRNCGIRTPTRNGTHAATPPTQTFWPTPTPTPTWSDCSTDTALCLGEGRFLVVATWTKPDGESGPAHAVALTADSGYFWFLDANNVEVAVKALNGCSVNGHSWIFSAGLTNLAVAMTVTDTTTNQSKTYSNPQGTPFQTIADTTTFAACPAGAESLAFGNPEEPGENVVTASQAAGTIALSESRVGCVGSDTVLCLNGRFQVEAAWQTTSGNSGVGHATNLTPESGYFWFFDLSNLELIVKALDACRIGRGQWLFAAGMTTVGVQLTVTDTFTGEVKIYGPTTAGESFVPILDTAAFSFCPTPTPTFMPTATPALTPTPRPTIPSTRNYTPTFSPTNRPTPTPGPPTVIISPHGGCRGYPQSNGWSFSPSLLHVRVGDTITWTWATGTHSVTSGIPGSPDGRWDSGIVAGPYSFAQTFTQSGTYYYYCRERFTIRGLVCASTRCSCLPLGTSNETGIVIVGP